MISWFVLYVSYIAIVAISTEEPRRVNGLSSASRPPWSGGLRPWKDILRWSRPRPRSTPGSPTRCRSDPVGKGCNVSAVNRSSVFEAGATPTPLITSCAVVSKLGDFPARLPPRCESEREAAITPAKTSRSQRAGSVGYVTLGWDGAEESMKHRDRADRRALAAGDAPPIPAAPQPRR